MIKRMSQLLSAATRSMPAAGVCLMVLAMNQGCTAQDPGFRFAVKDASEIHLDGKVVAQVTDPTTAQTPQTVRTDNGIAVVGDSVRKEYVCFDDRLEFTFAFALEQPYGKSLQIRVPLPDGATATITHGRTHPAPPNKLVVHGGTDPNVKSQFDPRYGIVGPAPPIEVQAGALFPLRFVQVQAPDYALSVDVQPGGAPSEDPSNAQLPLRMFSVAPHADHVLISASIPAGYNSFPGRIAGKIIFYHDGRSFEKAHLFAYASEYGPIESMLRIDFGSGPQKQKSDPVKVARNAYTTQTGHGWLSNVDALDLVNTSLDAIIHGSHVASTQAATFRVDAPPGYYFVTLNIGSADHVTGPMRVSINGERRMDGFHLDAGRFHNEALLTKARTGELTITLEGIDGATWRLDGLTVQPMGTLEEDFIFTRPWWHISP
ncbi:MAG: hypothetical protein QF785_03070 [Phycisphaeraceae bacterium]|nr:hypothetical protein [Phycisphaeraceae bacterium]